MLLQRLGEIEQKLVYEKGLAWTRSHKKLAVAVVAGVLLALGGAFGYWASKLAQTSVTPNPETTISSSNPVASSIPSSSPAPIQEPIVSLPSSPAPSTPIPNLTVQSTPSSSSPATPTPTPISPKLLSQAQLKSAVGVNYIQLQALLAAGKWLEADEETKIVMLKASRREKEGLLRVEDFQRFPCQDLRTIDQLWVKYSNGKFGFSVQNSIWQSVGGNPNAGSTTYQALGDGLGWRVNGSWKSYYDLTFALNAPTGHLPGAGGLWWGKNSGYLPDLLTHTDVCGL